MTAQVFAVDRPEIKPLAMPDRFVTKSPIL